MEKKNSQGKDFESLYKRIFESIVSSPEVKDELLHLLKKGKLNSHTIFVLMVKMEELLQAIIQLEVEAEDDMEEVRHTVKKKKKTRLLTGKKAQYIDGKELSQTEVEFEEYCRQSFDEDKWLKEAGIIYP